MHYLITKKGRIYGVFLQVPYKQSFDFLMERIGRRFARHTLNKIGDIAYLACCCNVFLFFIH